MDGRVVLGDIVVAIDGEWMQGMGFDVLKERIVGNIGTFVDLTFESVRYIPPSPFLQQIQCPSCLILHPSHFLTHFHSDSAHRTYSVLFNCDPIVVQLMCCYIFMLWK